MSDLAVVPEWVGTAVLGAVVAGVAYVGRQIVDLYLGRRAASRLRRSKLIRLLSLIRAGDTAFLVQVKSRNHLSRLVSSQAPRAGGEVVGFDQLFRNAFPTMSPEERELHTVIRSITVHTLKPLNDAILEWLAEDVDHKVYDGRDAGRRALAAYLGELEAHLILWRAKYEAWIPENEDRALVYLADEKEHGIEFPKGGVALLSTVLGLRSDRGTKGAS